MGTRFTTRVLVVVVEMVAVEVTAKILFTILLPTSVEKFSEPVAKVEVMRVELITTVFKVSVLAVMAAPIIVEKRVRPVVSVLAAKEETVARFSTAVDTTAVDGMVRAFTVARSLNKLTH